MIPITCPRCGRTGKVPPDRLNARLTCKKCEAAFHLDGGGKIVLGDPAVARSAAAPQWTAPAVEFDLGETWRGIPRPAKLGVPCLLALVAGWAWFPGWSGGSSFDDRAATIGRAVLDGDRAKAIALATPETAPAAERWYDIVHAPIAATGPGKVGPETIAAGLLDGNPEGEGELSVSLYMSNGSQTSICQLAMVKSGGEWRFDAAKSLADAERAAPPPVQVAKKR